MEEPKINWIDLKIALIRRRNTVSETCSISSNSVDGDLSPSTYPTSPTSIVLRLQPDNDVSAIKLRLAGQIGEKPGDIKLIFAGKPLQDNLKLSSLDVGPGTVVHAMISCEVDSQPMERSRVESNSSSTSFIADEDLIDRKIRAYFHVFCKKGCDKLQRGKLRVRCAKCKSPAVVLQEEPSCWNDVLSAPHLPCQCFGGHSDCSKNAAAEFFFRCTHCSDQSPELEVCAIPLTQVKSNTENAACATCGEVHNPIFEFLCDLIQHKVCIDCFVAYAFVSINERLFQLTDRFGYTLPCPVSGCTGCVTDPHSFRLLGVDQYRKFQKFATESYLLGQNGVFCPKPDCGEGFLVDSDAEVILLVCPTCGFSFCRNCKSSASQCSCDGNEDAAALAQSSNSQSVLSSSTSETLLSLDTIRKVCKQCPKCKVKTQRSGGCHHMHCRQCGFNWCWQCLKEWSDECQWDHWFD